MSLQTRLEAWAQSVGADVKVLKNAPVALPRLTDRISAAVTSKNTAYVATGLSLTLTAGKTYRLTAFGQYQSGALGNGIGFRLGAGATATRIRYTTNVYGVTSTTFTSRTLTALNATPAPSSGVANLDTDYGWAIDGLIVVNAGGWINIEFASEVAPEIFGSGGVTIQPNAYFEAQEIA